MPDRHLPKERLCVYCGQGFQTRNPTRAKYCSAECVRRGRYDDCSRSRTCELCGVPYLYTYNKQRTCGRTCGWALRKTGTHKPRVYKPWQPRPSPVYKPKPPVICCQCGAAFSARPSAKYCSDPCRKAAARAYTQEWERLHRPRPEPHCVTCGVAVGSRGKKCRPCLAVTRCDSRRRRKARARARRRSIASEPYTLAQIAARDRHRCGLCHRKVDMTLLVPHLRAPTIDHVLPIALGGDDTRANVQLAHFICNSRKRTGGTQQLAMIG